MSPDADLEARVRSAQIHANAVTYSERQNRLADVETVREAMLALSGHLPLFAADPHKVARAETHLALYREAEIALDRIRQALS